VSKYGTLLELFDANGKSRFGKLAGNGFEVRYESKGRTTSASAIGDENVTGLLPGQVKADEQSAAVTATTTDHAVEITTYFILDEKTKRLLIHRKFRNISGGPLTFKTMREFLDPALVISGETGSTHSEVLTGQKQSLSAEKLAALATNRLRASSPIDDCWAPDCPKGPPPCPIPCPTRLVANRAELITRTNPVGGGPDKIWLQWSSPITTTVQRNGVSRLVEVDFP